MTATDCVVSAGDGVRLFAHVLGDGPRMVLVPNGLHLVEDFAPLAAGRTLIFYDLRNRGRSDAIDDPALLTGGVVNDADDIDAVRRHVGAERIDLIGHSYVGLTAVLFALKYPDHVNRVVQIGAIAPDQQAQYPADRSNHDETYRSVIAAIGELQQQRGALDPVDVCRKFWDVLRPLYVTSPADAHRIRWDRCHLPNERAFMAYWIGHVVPSMQRLTLTREALAGVRSPVLCIHGTHDRSSPYGAALDWVARLPNARLVTVDRGGHAPWIEDPETVFGSIAAFLGGS
jgi:pimeloyl-ACP methyl ester carboxylesterase